METGDEVAEDRPSEAVATGKALVAASPWTDADVCVRFPGAGTAEATEEGSSRREADTAAAAQTVEDPQAAVSGRRPRATAVSALAEQSG